MENFNLHMPTKILFGKDQIQNIKQEIPPNARILLLYGGGSIKKNGVYDAVMAILSDFHVDTFAGIEANPEFETICKATEYARAQSTDFILAVGGGSVIDAAKLLAVGIDYQGDLWDIVLAGINLDQKISHQPCPFGSVLTLPATGSEMNSGSVISRRASNDKLFFNHPQLYPVFSVLDPAYTFSLDARQSANGIVDAFTHTMEQYLTCPCDAPLQDRISEGILQTLIEEGPKVMRNFQDYQARSQVMWCAAMALNGLIGAGVAQDWSTHMIGHELTAVYGLDHAQTLAIVLPRVLEYKMASKKQKLIQYGKRVWQLGGDDQTIADAAIVKTEAFFRSLGVKTYLSEYNISLSDEDLAQILAQLKSHQMDKLGEHGDILLEDSKNILQSCAVLPETALA